MENVFSLFSQMVYEFDWSTGSTGGGPLLLLIWFAEVSL